MVSRSSQIKIATCESITVYVLSFFSTLINMHVWTINFICHLKHRVTFYSSPQSASDLTVPSTLLCKHSPHICPPFPNNSMIG